MADPKSEPQFALRSQILSFCKYIIKILIKEYFKAANILNSSEWIIKLKLNHLS